MVPFGVLALITFDILFKRVQGKMRRRVTKMHKERLIALGKTIDRLNCMIRKSVSRVISFWKLCDWPVVVRERATPSAIVEHRIWLGWVEEIAATIE